MEGVEDSGYMVYAQADVSDLTKWTENKRVLGPINMRHGSFLFNDGKEIVRPESQSYYRDPTPVDPVNPVNIKLVDNQTKDNAYGIRQKTFGIDVRELFARSLEWLSSLVTKNTLEVNNVTNEMSNLNDRFDNVIAGATEDSEIKDSRVDADGTVHKTLKDRLDFQQVNYGRFGETVKVDESDEMMIIRDFTEDSAGLQYSTIQTLPEQPIHASRFTIKLEQLIIKEEKDG